MMTGRLETFLSFNRQYLDQVGSEDSLGRTIWALGFLIYSFPNESYQKLGLEIFKKSLPFFKHLKDLRGIANTILGMSYYTKRFPDDKTARDLMFEMTYKIINIYNKENLMTGIGLKIL